MHFLERLFRYFVEIAWKLIPESVIDNISPSLVHIVILRPGTKPLSAVMLTQSCMTPYVVCRSSDRINIFIQFIKMLLVIHLAISQCWINLWLGAYEVSNRTNDDAIIWHICGTIPHALPRVGTIYISYFSVCHAGRQWCVWNTEQLVFSER